MNFLFLITSIPKRTIPSKPRIIVANLKDKNPALFSLLLKERNITKLKGINDKLIIIAKYFGLVFLVKIEYNIGPIRISAILSKKMEIINIKRVSEDTFSGINNNMPKATAAIKNPEAIFANELE